MSTVILNNIDISPLLKAADFLNQGLQQAHSELEKAGTIQAFEICYELAWKTMKKVLAYRGINASSPREVFRYAAQEKLITDLDFWFETLLKRNLTTHIYNKNVAEEIFNFLPKFDLSLNNFITLLKTLKK